MSIGFEENFICWAGATEVKKNIYNQWKAVERWIEIVNWHFAKSEGLGHSLSPGLYIVQLWRIQHAGAVTLCTCTFT